MLKKIAKIISNDNRYTTAFFEISSPGGNVLEAIRIGSLMKKLYASIGVGPNSHCSSACFLIWLNGAQRLASGDDDPQEARDVIGSIIIHRPYFVHNINNESDIVTNGQQQMDVMRAMKEYLENNMVPRIIIDEMLSRPSNDGYVLKRKDLNTLGELAPWFEENAITKCHYYRNIRDDYINAGTMGGKAWSRFKIKFDKILDCTKNLRIDTSVIFQDKLSEGVQHRSETP